MVPESPEVQAERRRRLDFDLDLGYWWRRALTWLDEPRNLTRLYVGCFVALMVWSVLSGMGRAIVAQFNKEVKAHA